MLSLTHSLTACSPQVAEAYKCSPVEGVLSHQMKKHVIDANKVVINKATTEQQAPSAPSPPRHLPIHHHQCQAYSFNRLDLRLNSHHQV